MTDITDPIAHAARLLREAADELQQGHTLSGDRNNWIGEPEAKAAYDEHMAAALALEDWEAAVGAGGVQPLPQQKSFPDNSQQAQAAINSGASGGVQALSAAPVGWKLVPEDATDDMVRATDAVNFANGDTDATMHDVWHALLAASPTPPAEQPFVDQKHEDLSDKRVCASSVSDKPGAVYAELPEPALQSTQCDSTMRYTTLSSFSAEQMQDHADRTHALRIQAAPKAAPGEPRWWRKRADEIEAQVALTGSPEAMRCYTDMRTLLQAAAEAAPECPTCNDHGAVGNILTAEPCPDCTAAPQQEAQYNHGPQAETVEEAARDVGKWLNERPNRPLDLRHVAMLAHYATAPQQEAQEPVLFLSPGQLAALTEPDGAHGRYLPVRKTRRGMFTMPLYTAPQPAPAPATPDGDELRKIARAARTSASDDASPTEYVLAGWRAALAAQKGTP